MPLTLTPQLPEVVYKSHPIQQPFAFEVYCPLSCAGVGIGCYKPSTNHLESFEFRTTTQRTVSVSVNHNIVCLVNGNKPQNKDKKKTDSDKDWGIGLKVKDKGNLAVLNPYVITSNPLSLYVHTTLTQTLLPVKGESHKPIREHFAKKELDLSGVRSVVVGRRTVYLKNHLLCYNQTFDLPTSKDAVVTLADPQRPGYFWVSPIHVIKTELNEEVGFWLRQLEITIDAFKSKGEPSERPKFNLDEIYSHLDTLLRIDEQLRCRLLNSKAEDIYRELYPNILRLYTALQRLSSFVGYSNTKYSIVKLAELGFYNKTDSLQSLGHYESPSSEISNIEEGGSAPESSLLDQQLPFLRSRNGLPFPNVPLETSLSSHPAQVCGSEQPVVMTSTSCGRYLGTVSSDKKFSLWSAEQQLLNLISFDITKLQEEKKAADPALQPALAELSVEPAETERKQEADKPAKVVEPDSKILEQLIGMGFPSALCLKALLMTENESVQAAIDMIEELKAEEEKTNKKAKEENKLKIKAEWQCRFCTLRNFAPHEVCEICANPAPEDAFVNEEEQKKKELERQKQEEEARQKEKADQELRAQQDLKAQQEEEERKKKELEHRRLQEQHKLEELLLSSTLSDFKISSQHDFSPLKPFLVYLLFTHSGTSRLRVFRVGLSAAYLAKFYRQIENKSVIVSNYDQSIHPNSPKGIAQLIHRAREQVEWRRKLFEPVAEGEWVVDGVKDVLLDDSYHTIEVMAQRVRLIGNNTLHFEVRSEEDLIKGGFEVLKVEEAAEWKPEESAETAEPQPEAVDLSAPSAGSESTLPAGTCFLEVQLIEHLPADGYPLIAEEVSLASSPSQSNLLAQSEKSIMSNYIPLALERWEGSCCNEKHIPSTLFQPGPLYISNYGATSFTFRSLRGLPMIVETVTVLSELKTLNGGNPVNSGLVFTANEIGWFGIAKKRFWKMKKSQYAQWLEGRKAQGEELAFWEPVGAFELKDGEKSIEFELDFKRPTKYIYLLPTSLKKQNKELEEAEVNFDFFGVKGRLISELHTPAASTSSQIESQGSHCCPVQVLAVDESGEKDFPPDSIIIEKKSQVNGIEFINALKPENVKGVPLSVTTYMLVRVKNSTGAQVRVRCSSEHLKKLRVVSHSGFDSVDSDGLLRKLSGEDKQMKEAKDSQLVGQLLQQFYINPLLAEKVADKLDIGRFIRLYVLWEKDSLFEVDNLLKILEKQKGFKERLLK